MCVSAAAAHFSDTVLYVGRVDHPVFGHIEVVGHQNTTANREILADMVRAVTPPMPYGPMASYGAT